ncbi:MAG: DUF892 family protein [Pedobacter sp.]|nr:DUF892 family protein [Pedobacter sp.]MDQ8051599.1 DUF892 family protein [Pedobacter sp.]
MSDLSPQTIFVQHLAKLTALEKKLGPMYHKLEKAAFAAELAKALSDEGTDHQAHLQRLLLIKQSGKFSLDAPKVVFGTELPSFKAKKASPTQDLEIIALALYLQGLKLSSYELLHPLASSLGLEQEAVLLEQTINDHRNTNTWLRQLVQNVVVPISLG